MSESNSVEISDELAAEIAAINAGEDLDDDDQPVVAEPEAVEAPPAPVETPPETPAAPSVDLPDWAADLSEDDRAAAAQRLIDSLPPDKRGSLPAIQQTAQYASQLTAQQVQQQQAEQAAAAERDAELAASAENFATDLQTAINTQGYFDVEARTNELIDHSQRIYHDTLADDIQNGLLGSLGRLGVQDLPAPVVQRINNAPSYGGVIQAYVDFAADRAFELGKLAERNDQGKKGETDEKVSVNRYKNQAIAQAARDGRVRISKDDEGFFYSLVDDTPPALGTGGSPTMSGGDELSQEQFDELVNDQDKYDAFMESPENRARWNRTIALAARRG